jgi:hypothetical protein
MTQAKFAASDDLYCALYRVEDDAARTSGMAAWFTDLKHFGFSLEDIAATREAWNVGAGAKGTVLGLP